MSMKLISHVFAGNPIKPRTSNSTDTVSPASALQTLKSSLLNNTNEASSCNFKILPFRKGRPLAGSSGDDSRSSWHLGWLNFDDFKIFLENSGVEFTDNSIVYLGFKSEEDVVYWAVDVSDGGNLVNRFGSRQLCFVELRTLMVATDWADQMALADLAVAGHARALLEWHNTSRFCANCGAKTVSVEAGRRKQCSSEACNKRI